MRLKNINQEEFKENHSKYTNVELSKIYGVNINTITDWQKKLNLPRKKFKHLDLQEEPSNYQKQIIIGSMLGDGTLSKIYRDGNSYFYEEHSIAQQKWLEYKQEMLKPFSLEVEFRKRPARIIENGKLVDDNTRTLESCNFYTITHPFFTELEYKWYARNEDGVYKYKILDNGKKQRIKILPKDLEINEFILSIWFIDDGYNGAECKQMGLCTQSFDEKEVEILVGKIKRIGIIDCSIVRCRSGFNIHINVNSYLDIINLIENNLPNLPIELKYKIDSSKFAKSEIPFFHIRKEKYIGRVQVSNKVLYFEGYKKEIAQKISEEIITLKKSFCNDFQEYLKIKNKYVI